MTHRMLTPAGRWAILGTAIFAALIAVLAILPTRFGFG
jgi:hypothetical protein